MKYGLAVRVLTDPAVAGSIGGVGHEKCTAVLRVHFGSRSVLSPTRALWLEHCAFGSHHGHDGLTDGSGQTVLWSGRPLGRLLGLSDKVTSGLGASRDHNTVTPKKFVSDQAQKPE